MHLDGNVLAGALADVFAQDATAATGRCAGCGAVSELARAHVYTRAPGLVARCASCGYVLLTVVETPAGTRVSVSGLRGLAFV
ncbi:DUF6510 family protein [Herbiconiux sp. SYSU D00978]|uniref:DUF6510 family protein n=1 Tax=Herbiconiux sp. SYSU D00978 TaxID=2812562 RepID=UPI001A9647E1|nr:DUF6510 family protein [Herbiconiux sp. SYSU D00978]